MNLILFFIMILISFIGVRIGAVAFQLTGLEWTLSKFQALSCFTSTGFTTREAELIVSNPQRRKIATILMILGNAGFVALIATFANSLRTPDYVTELKIPFLELFIPSQYLPWVNLLIIIVVLYLGYKIFTHKKIARKATKMIKNHIKKEKFIKPVTFEEILVSTGGYGVLSIEVNHKSPVLDKTLDEAELRNHGVMVLVIERDGYSVPIPKFNTKILLGDRLVCFGLLDNIKNELVKG